MDTDNAAVHEATNPLDPSERLAVPTLDQQIDHFHPSQPPLVSDSAVTKAEKIERNAPGDGIKRKLSPSNEPPDAPPRKKGVAAIKSE